MSTLRSADASYTSILLQRKVTDSFIGMYKLYAQKKPSIEGLLCYMAPSTGLEPVTCRLTAGCSTN